VATAAVALAAAWRQREIGGGGSKAAPRHGGGAAAARQHHQWRQRQRWGRMTKAAAVMLCGGEFFFFCVFSILMFGEKAVCLDDLFVPAVFRESKFYLNQHLPLTLFADSLTLIKWYVNASHQTHDDCKGHTGSLLTFRKGAATSSSTKQKVPSKSSTKSKLIGLYDKSGNILWACHFLEAQGYTITTNIVYQDNMSTLSLAKNGYVSSLKRTKHIKAKYLYIRHYHNSGELELQYCPTDMMWADVLTKPLQGSKFQRFRAFLMNCRENYTEEPPLSLSSTIPMTARVSQPKVSKTKPSPRECVRAQPYGTKVPSDDRELIPKQGTDTK
jgi:hypothetical protein